METPDEKAWMAERNRLVLVRTAGIVSWLYAVERGITGLALLQSRSGEGLYEARLFGTFSLAHAALLVAAGAAFIRDLRWAWAPALLAAAGAVFFVVLHADRSNWTGAGVDAAYAAVAALALLKRRHSA